jgi:hypothetical protein
VRRIVVRADDRAIERQRNASLHGERGRDDAAASLQKNHGHCLFRRSRPRRPRGRQVAHLTSRLRVSLQHNHELAAKLLKYSDPASWTPALGVQISQP